MKTREEYKKYYLNKLNKMFGDNTQADYNSAEDFCYKEEWDLSNKKNSAAAIDGLGDAWMEYKDNFDNISSSLEPEWTVFEPNFKNLKPRHESDPKNGWGAMEEEQKKVIEDNDYKVVVKYGYGGSCTLCGAETGEVISPFSTIKDMQDFKKKNNLTIVKNSRRSNMIKSSYKDNYGIEDLKLVSEQAEEYASNILSAARDWIPSKEYNQFQKKEFKSGDWTVVVDPDGTFGWNGAGLGIYYYYKTQYSPIFEKEYKLNQHYDYESQSWNNLLVQTPRSANGLRDLTAGNSEKTNTVGIDWEEVLRTLKTIISSKRRNNMKMQFVSTSQYLNNGALRNKTSLRALFSNIESIERDKHWFRSIIENWDSPINEDLNITYFVLDYDNCEAIFSFKVLYHDITRYGKLKINDGWYYLDIYKDSDLQELDEEYKGTDNGHLVEDFKNAYWFFTDRPAPLDYYCR